jgi:SAM-dependent methyltransferase
MANGSRRNAPTETPTVRFTAPTAVWDTDRRPSQQPFHPIAKIAGSAEALKRDFDRLGDTLQAHALKSMPMDEHRSRMEADRWPLPQAGDREGYYGDAHTLYWLSGLADQVFLSRLTRSASEDMTILDFGCASGRVLRHFGATSGGGLRALAVDVNRRNIAWMREHLDQPSLELLRTTYDPPLPLETGSVDLIYALSVFTHIDEFEEAWLAEIQRTLRPGGRAFLTYHSERTWSLLADPSVGLDQVLLAGE